MKTQFTGTQLEELANKLHVSIYELVNKDHLDFKKYFGNPNLADKDWITIIRKNPQFIKEPIAIKGEKIKLVNTSSDIVKL